MSSGIVDGLRQPEYTGENRCVPCTIVNTAIAAGLSVVVAAAVVVGTARLLPALVLGVAVFGVCAAAIYLRGYLVPETPELTKRYFPERVLAWFDKDPEPGVGFEAPTETDAATGTGTDAGEATDEGGLEQQTIDEDLEPEQALLSAGAVEECVDVDDLCLEESFGAAWRDRIRSVRQQDPDAEAILEALDMPEMDGEVRVEHYGDAVVLEHEGRQIGKWESSAALIADLSAAGELAERYDRWPELGAFDRSRILRGLRIFVDQCPECDGRISLGQETVESCCRSFDVVAVTCEQCDSRLFEERLQDEAA